ncbi:MAG: tRNA (adenosine(37)-N6)-dimethylallyltransferase MiaA [Treponema sp.]|nr:tRNA (adenosine(37)-N6)-dimethylallyltransferase MiaA [Treponema sp.]
MRIPVVVLFAPTATGKTAVALKIFGAGGRSFFNGRAELISADSMQAYRGLNIGTAKPTALEMERLPHHLIDIHNFDEQYTVAEFVERADALCRDIWMRGKIPLVAGGTGFYIRNFLLGMPETPPSDEKVRCELRARAEKWGREAMFKELCKVDSISAKKINPNDEYRILRALEIFSISGKPRSDFTSSNTLRDAFDFITIILERSRPSLYERINARVDAMFEMGFESEVRNLISKGATKDMPGMQAIGYREWFEFAGEGVEKIKEEIKHSSRKYAKKQYTFTKGIPNAFFICTDNEDEMVFKIEEHLMSLKLFEN